jgi:hypothetical protein
MSIDPRLADVQLLTLAALRLRQRQEAEPKPRLVFQVTYYDARGIEPDELGERYVYELVHAKEGGDQWRLIPD